MALVIHIDGGSRGNPGPAGAGVVIRQGETGPLLLEAGFFLGVQTNNAAEYLALIRALEHVARLPDDLQINSDSELLVRQMTGEYRVRNPQLQELHGRAERLLLREGRWHMRHVRRELNRRADELANMAMDHRTDVIVHGDSGGKDPDSPPVSQSTQTAPEPPQEITAGDPSRPVRVVMTKPPNAGECPAGAWCRGAFEVRDTLSASVCLHAAHAILPTVLAIKNTAAPEFHAVPPLTVRCSRNGCGAVFQVAPQSAGNGKH